MAIAKRQLGNTGIEVSVLSWGTVKVGRNFMVKNKTPDGFPLPDDATVLKLITICLEHGINLIDLAPAYGIAEERIGKLLVGKRTEFILSTKVGEEFDGENSTYNFSKEHLIFSIERSLKRLKTDYLDTVLLHLPRNDLETMQTSAALETLAELKKKGLIRSYGASTHSVAGGLFALENSDIAMIPFNPDYQEHLSVIENAEFLGKSITVKKGLLSGHLDSKSPQTSLRKCFQAALQHQGVKSLVAGTINPEHLLQNIKLVQELDFNNSSHIV